MATTITGRIIPQEGMSLDATTLTGGYDELCDGLDYPAYLVRFTSTSDEPVEISFDAIYDHEFLPAGKTVELTGSHMEKCEFPKGQKVWVKGTAGKIGYIYMSAYTNRKDV